MQKGSWQRADCGACERLDAESAQPGRYGFAVGQVVPDLSLRGFINPLPTPDTMSSLDLDAFLLAAQHKPLRHEESPAHASQGPHALLLELGCGWSRESRERVEHTIPSLLAAAPAGAAEGFMLLVEGEHPGQGADTYNLIDLTRQLQVHFPAAIDPTASVAAHGFGKPRLLLVNGATRRVEAELFEGVPGVAFRKAWEHLVSEP
jgi:hypothetical protein